MGNAWAGQHLGRRKGREGWLTSVPLRRKSFRTAEGPAGREAGWDQQGKAGAKRRVSGAPQARLIPILSDPQQHFLDDPKYGGDDDLPSKLEAFKSEEGCGQGGKLGAGGAEDQPSGCCGRGGRCLQAPPSHLWPLSPALPILAIPQAPAQASIPTPSFPMSPLAWLSHLFLKHTKAITLSALFLTSEVHGV